MLTASLVHVSHNMITIPLISTLLVGDGPVSFATANLLESIPLAAICLWIAWSGQMSPRPALAVESTASGPRDE